VLEATTFDEIRIGLATSENIRAWSHGEVKESLFGEQIFGPSRDWECACGKYKRVRFKGIVCEHVAGGWSLIALIVLLGLISFLQRFNRVRQVRAVEAMSVASAQLALDQVRRAQDLKVIEERVNSILHGSVQSTLLALELGLQSGDESVATHSTDALSHLRKAVAQLEEPTQAPSEDFERAIENIVSVWAGSMRVTVDQSPDAADALHSDPLAASAVIEVVKEGTQNAVKHSDTRDVRVVIGIEGSLVRVRVSHRSAGQPVSSRSSGLGMRYLGAITRTLRLVDDGTTTTLYAEIPTSATVAA
jgi:glucose-6-phosphate-specific signal transduction histidine kinase